MTLQHAMGRLLVSICLCLALNTCKARTQQKPTPQPAATNEPAKNTLVASLEGFELSEVSGIAASQKRDHLFWMINDSGNGSNLHAFHIPSSKVLKIKVKGAKNRDWEDLTSFRYKGQPYLLIPDTGDNKGKRQTVQLYLVKEPELNFEQDQNLSLRPERVIELSYEDGPLDCESVTFDPNTQSILFLGKRMVPPVLYGLTLAELFKSGPKTATRLAQATGIPRPTPVVKYLLPKKWKYSAQPTAMDISSDGRFMVVLTYLTTWIFERKGNQTWAEVLIGKPQAVATPLLPQAEAICFERGNKALFLISEDRPDLFRVPFSL